MPGQQEREEHEANLTMMPMQMGQEELEADLRRHEERLRAERLVAGLSLLREWEKAHHDGVITASESWMTNFLNRYLDGERWAERRRGDPWPSVPEGMSR